MFLQVRKKQLKERTDEDIISLVPGLTIIDPEFEYSEMVMYSPNARTNYFRQLDFER
jgi:hypothetical protein